MLRAVNRDLKAMPAAVESSALAELARELAREFDGGNRKINGDLRRALVELARAARSASKSKPASAVPAAAVPAEEVAEHDDIDAIKAERAVRRDEFARRRARRAGAAVHDGAESEPAAGRVGGG